MSLTTEAFARIRDAIVSGTLEFGEQLSETQIARALGMSKAPVRAAFMELKDKGLVNIVPQSGTYVFSPTAEDIRTLSHFRALLESEAVREAMKWRADPLCARLDSAIDQMKVALSVGNWDAYRAADSSYHQSFLAESGNRYLLKAYFLSASALEALSARLQNAGNFRAQSYGDHIEIARLLRGGKTDEACRLLRAHILVINDSLESLPLDPKRTSRRSGNYAEVFGAPDRPGTSASASPERVRRAGSKQATAPHGSRLAAKTLDDRTNRAIRIGEG